MGNKEVRQNRGKGHPSASNPPAQVLGISAQSWPFGGFPRHIRPSLIARAKIGIKINPRKSEGKTELTFRELEHDRTTYGTEDRRKHCNNDFNDFLPIHRHN